MIKSLSLSKESREFIKGIYTFFLNDGECSEEDRTRIASMLESDEKVIISDAELVHMQEKAGKHSLCSEKGIGCFQR